MVRILPEKPDSSFAPSQHLGETYQSAIAEMRTIGLSHSARKKLARFLLDLSAEHGDGKRTEVRDIGALKEVADASICQDFFVEESDPTGSRQLKSQKLDCQRGVTQVTTKRDGLHC